MDLPPVQQQHFRRVCSKYATGIAILTVLDQGGAPHGMTINSFTSVSLSPPLILVCVDYSSTLVKYFALGTHFGVNVLGEEQKDLSTRFAQTGHDRFEGVEWSAGNTGSPILSEALAALECGVVRMAPAGDHLILIAEVSHASWREGQPLIYFNSSYQGLRTLD